MAHEQLPMKEALFVGTVTHNRKIDVAHGFTYPIWMSFSDLSASRLPRLIRPNSAKYLTVSRIQELLDTQLADTQHDIWLLTQPGLIGRSFNPVSFYFVTEQGAVRWIVAHITNTPGMNHTVMFWSAQIAIVGTLINAFMSHPFCPWH